MKVKKNNMKMNKIVANEAVIKYHGYTRENFLLYCARNIILKVPAEQDDLLVEYDTEIANAIVLYVNTTTSENLEMIFQNEFAFEVAFNSLDRVCRLKFEYYY